MSQPASEYVEPIQKIKCVVRHIHLGALINAFIYTNKIKMVDPPPDMPPKGKLFIKLIQLLLGP